MPFLYTTLEEAHRTGVPLFRPLLLNYQDDENTYTIDDQFMIGTELLVAPILSPGLTERLVYLPKGTWYDYWTNKKYSWGETIKVAAPLETVPMFVRAGSIIPKGPEMNFVGEKPAQPSFVIYPDEEGKAAATLYEDDGLSPAYKDGVFRRTSVRVSKGGNEIRINVAAPEGTFKPAPRMLSFLIHTKLSVKKVSVDANPLPSAGKNGSAWHQSGDVLIIRIPDDGRPHGIEIK